MPGRLRHPFAVLAVAVCACLVCTGCSRRTDVTFIPDGGTYTADEVRTLATEIEVSGYAEVEAEEIAELRSDTLAKLRSRGEGGSEVASLLTRLFPADTAAVPIHIEAATVEGVDAWIVIEVWARRDGPLVNRRVWVFDRETEAVLLAVSFT